MKRKDFLRRMRSRRRQDPGIQEREPERRRATDWRTLRLELPQNGEARVEHTDILIGKVQVSSGGIVLKASSPCWVRGYRRYTADSGLACAEFQYRPLNEPAEPPPGATALEPGERWQPV